MGTDRTKANQAIRSILDGPPLDPKVVARFRSMFQEAVARSNHEWKVPVFETDEKDEIFLDLTEPDA